MAKSPQRHAPPTGYLDGTMETRRFANCRESYWQGIDEILKMGIAPADLIHHAPAFAGHINLARYLALYEAYKMALPFAGHIAEAGIWKGSCTIFFAKLTRMFEPDSNTLVHGFDWFQGARPEGDEAKLVQQGLYAASFEFVSKLVSVQGLDDVVRLHNLDLSKDLPAFFADHPHLQFKLVFLDCGLYKVVRACLEHFWPRLTPGGVLILDNLNHETSPGETAAVRELLPDMPVRSFGFAFQPTAYIIKG
jgi:methyltransferase family protein